MQSIAVLFSFLHNIEKRERISQMKTTLSEDKLLPTPTPVKRFVTHHVPTCLCGNLSIDAKKI